MANRPKLTEDQKAAHAVARVVEADQPLAVRQGPRAGQQATLQGHIEATLRADAIAIREAWEAAQRRADAWTEADGFPPPLRMGLPINDPRMLPPEFRAAALAAEWPMLDVFAQFAAMTPEGRA